MSDTSNTPEAAQSAAVPNAEPAIDAAEAARLKREARKSRILSKGSDRLARITNAGRGEGASAYLNDTALSPPRPTAPSTTATTAAARADDDDPLEVDVSALPRMPQGEEATNPFAMFGGGAPGAEGQQNPMEALMAMMQGGAGSAGGPGGAGGQPDMSGLPPQLAAMMQQLGGAAGPGGPGAANAAPTTTQRKPLSERAFDLLQAILVLALAVLAAKSSLFDLDRSSAVPDSVKDALQEHTAFTTSTTSTLQRWARLGYQKPSPLEWTASSVSGTSSLLSSFTFLPPGFAALPLFYIFLSLEILLQAIRITIFSRKTPAPPSLLSTLTMMLPIPNLHMAIKLISKYLALLNAFVNDVSLLVFVFGAAVLWSGYELGGVGMLDASLAGSHDEL